MKRMILILVAVALCACGCKTAKKSPAVTLDESGNPVTTQTDKKAGCSLTNTKWVLTKLFGQPVADSQEKPFIVFTGDRVTGSLGCNTFFGTFYANKKGKLEINYTGSTKRLCNEMEVENKFLSAMKTEKMSYVIMGKTLIVKGERMSDEGMNKEYEIMRFVAEE